MGEHDDAALVELLDVDGEALHEYWSDALTCVEQAAAGTDRRRILDLGAGTGTGAIGLAQRFAGAEVIAVDASDPMLERIRVKARDLGLASRIRTVQADLDAGWPEIGPVDVTWASMSMHHFADPDLVLGHVFATTRSGGVLAVAEFSEELRFLPDDLGFGRPGLEARCLDALNTEHSHSLPDLGSHWAPRLERAGFALLDERTFAIDVRSPHPPAAADYAYLWLRRLHADLADRLSDDDRATLGTLVDGDGPESLLHRDDVHIRGSRTVTLARRP